MGSDSSRAFSHTLTNAKKTSIEITDVRADTTTETTATIKWTTSIPATATVRYGARGKQIDQSKVSSTLTGEHAVILDGLQPNMEYYYDVIVRSADGTSAQSEVKSFQTRIIKKSSETATKKIIQGEKNADAQTARLVLRLQRRLTALEEKIMEQEKKLVQRIDRVLSRKVAGRILLQVEENGEAWYVDPQSENKLYLKDGLAAYDIMRGLGLGISNSNLEKIPIGAQDKLYDLTDTDGDGLPDKLEEAIGTDPSKKDSDDDSFEDKTEVLANYKPNGKDRYPIDSAFGNKFKGRILLQVESKGEAWYINPADGKRYFLGDPNTAYNAMRFLSSFVISGL